MGKLKKHIVNELTGGYYDKKELKKQQKKQMKMQKKMMKQQMHNQQYPPGYNPAYTQGYIPPPHQDYNQQHGAFPPTQGYPVANNQPFPQPNAQPHMKNKKQKYPSGYPQNNPLNTQKYGPSQPIQPFNPNVQQNRQPPLGVNQMYRPPYNPQAMAQNYSNEAAYQFAPAGQQQMGQQQMGRRQFANPNYPQSNSNVNVQMRQAPPGPNQFHPMNSNNAL
ncbi:hypothetical protein MHBO_002307 [Bonamia ostreae]|uniref:Uncharacterized protein n=1 Tax=Bonamia ostreae TaxID=126728 RepID=A0ABV2ALV9_9EUKA